MLTSDRRDRMPLPTVVGRAVRVEDLYREHYLDLVRFAVQFVDDRGIAEDVVQDVFAALKAHRRHLDDPLRYLRVAVLNRSRPVLRRRRIERRFVLGRERYAEAADEASLRSDEQSRVLAAVSGCLAGNVRSWFFATTRISRSVRWRSCSGSPRARCRRRLLAPWTD